MYTVCLYCSHALGRNEMVEAFPVGRRLAFDAARGRLWVVCPSCQRWCLTPIEERWEAIEACEKLFRDARVRASTGEIGLVRLAEGLELVRVGTPLLPEISAWRYGREFSARRRKAVLAATGMAGVAVVGAATGVLSGAASAWVGLFALGGAPVIHMTALLGFTAYAALDNARAIKLRHDGRELHVLSANLRDTSLFEAASGDGWGLQLKHSYGRLTLTGAEAQRATARLLARANGSGAPGWLARSSAERLMASSSLDAFIRDTARYSNSLSDEYAQRRKEFQQAFARNAMTAGKFNQSRNPGSLSLLAPPTRLALEMALHEESERAALDGELAPLIVAWREAEEIAGISDALLVSPAVEEKFAEMTKKFTP